MSARRGCHRDRHGRDSRALLDEHCLDRAVPRLTVHIRHGIRAAATISDSRISEVDADDAADPTSLGSLSSQIYGTEFEPTVSPPFVASAELVTDLSARLLRLVGMQEHDLNVFR